MNILPISLIHTKTKHSFKSKTTYSPDKVVEENILSIKNEKSVSSNPLNLEQNFFATNISRKNENTITIKSKSDVQAGIINFNKDVPQPKINVQMGEFQPVIEVNDDELGITILLTGGSKLEGKNLNINYSKMPQTATGNISFGANKFLIASDSYSALTANTVKNYYLNDKNSQIQKSNYSDKLKNDYSIIGLPSRENGELKILSDFGNTDTVKMPGTGVTLLENGILDTVSTLPETNNAEYYTNNNKKKAGSAGLLIQALKEGKIPENKPLVVVSGGHFTNIDLAKILYDFERDDTAGIAMVVNKVDNDDYAGKAPVVFDGNNNITNLYGKITSDTPLRDINDKKVGEDVYASSNITIVSPEVLSILKNYADKDGNADFVEFIGLMYNFLNKQNENLSYKYPDDLKSKDLKIENLTNDYGYPKLLKNSKGENLSFKVIKAEDKNGNSAKSYNVGTIEDYIKVVKKISDENISGFPSELVNSVKNLIDDDGIICYSQEAKEKLKLFKEKYGIDKLSGNAAVYAQKPKETNNNSSYRVLGTEKNIYDLTKDKNASRELVKNLVSSQNNATIMKNLTDTYGLKNVVKWYCDLQGYYGEYEKYMDEFYSNAKSLDELLKHQPNWTPWKLEEKAWFLDNENRKISDEQKLSEFYNYCDSEREYSFKIGELPQEFSNIVEYRNLINKLKTQNIHDMSININNRNCRVKRLKGGDLNDKFVYTLTFDDKKYILKFDRTNIEDVETVDGRMLSNYEKRTIRKNKCLSADSIFVNSCVNRYLELNGCKSVPHLYLYDHETHSSVYEFVEDINKDKFQNDLMDEEYVSIDDMNAKYDDLSKFGIYLNDTALKNSLTNKEGKEIIIDLGHCSFIQPFKPGVKRYNIDLPNINGPDINNIYASLLMAINEQ